VRNPIGSSWEGFDLCGGKSLSFSPQSPSARYQKKLALGHGSHTIQLRLLLGRIAVLEASSLFGGAFFVLTRCSERAEIE